MNEKKYVVYFKEIVSEMVEAKCLDFQLGTKFYRQYDDNYGYMGKMNITGNNFTLDAAGLYYYELLGGNE